MGSAGLNQPAAGRMLSARETFFVKFVFPTIWIAIFGLGTLALFRNHRVGDEPGPWGLPMRWGFFAIWVTGVVFMAWTCFPVKRVRLEGQVLCISNYVREIRVPLSDVTGVTENRYVSDHPISIAFRTPTVFGQKIVFIPPNRILWPWKRHPMLAELTALVLEAGGAPTVPTND